MYTTFTYLNKGCLKDDFPLLRIDKVVDSTVGCETVALLDFFPTTIKFGYERKMRKKTSFNRPFNTYC
jgi:hypothetical protein